MMNNEMMKYSLSKVLTCWVGSMALKSNMRKRGSSQTTRGSGCRSSKTKERREASLAVESLKSRWEDGSGWWLTVATVHVALDSVNTG